MKHLFQIVFIVFFISNLSFAQSNNSKQQWEQFNTANEESLEIIWNQYSNTFSKMMGKTSQSYGSTADESVVNFINQHKNLLGIQENEFELIQTKRTSSKNGLIKYQYQQTYKDVPVMNSGYLISSSKDGFIEYISGDFYSDITMDVTAALPNNSTIKVVEENLETDKFTILENPELSIYPKKINGKEFFYLVYSITVDLEQNTDVWEFLIDARDGSIIEKKSLITHLFMSEEAYGKTENYNTERNPKYTNVSNTLTNGTGTVYKTSPSLGTTSIETLYRLDNLSPRKLQGDNVIVDRHNVADASSSTGAFNYSSSDPEFEEVMVYYHSDGFENWLINNGMSTSQVDDPVTAFTRHSGGVYAGASPSLGELYFKFSSSGRNNPTKEAAVITHEYMHIVSATYNTLDDNNEEKAMNEAYSDYFALAYRNTLGNVSGSILGEYIDQPGGINYTRDLDNSYTMDDYYTIEFDNFGGSSYHEKSVIFSGALWDLRNDTDVSPGIVDELVLVSLENLDASPSYLDAMYALIEAANNSLYSAYVDDIEDAFMGKKIYVILPSAPTNLTITNIGSSGFPNLDWDDNTEPNLDYYNVYRTKKRLSDGYIFPAELIGSPTSSTYTDSWIVMGSGNPYDYQYKVQAVSTSGFTSSFSNSTPWVNANAPFKVLSQRIPDEYTLDNNYPNPFNPSTQIKFELPETAEVSIKVYNIMGQEVATIVNDQMQAGFHNATFKADNLSSGVYIARITATGTSGEEFVSEIKMQLIK
ncbi:MAG: T9SS type A sorting domain-containing protein [Balneola sp.]